MSLLLFALVIAKARFDAGTTFDHLFVALVCAVGAMFVVRFLANYFAVLASASLLDTRELSSLGFSNRRFFGQLQTLTLPLLAVPLLIVRERRIRITLFLLLALWWTLAFVSATRGTFLGMAAAAIVVLSGAGVSGHRWLRWQAAGLVAGVVLYALLIIVVPNILGLETVVESRWERLLDSSGRIRSWIFTLDLIRSHPMWGVGPMHLAYWLNPAVPVAHPHNSMLQVSAEWGIPAALLAAGWAVHAFGHYVKRFRGREATPLTVALAAALSGSAAQSLVDGVVVMPVTQVMLAVTAGWAYGLYRQECEPRRGNFHLDVETRALLLLLLAATSVLAWTTLRDAPLLHARQQQYFDAHSQYLHPRYWQQGWIGEPRTEP